MDFMIELKTIVSEVQKLVELHRPITEVEYTRWNNILVKAVVDKTAEAKKEGGEEV